MQFRKRFKIETTTIFSMLDLENLPQKKLGILAVYRKSTDPLDVYNKSRISSFAMFRVLPTGSVSDMLALYCHLAVEKHYNRPSSRS